MTPTTHMNRREQAGAGHLTGKEPGWIYLLLGLLVFLICLGISNGRFHSVDESAMYVAAHNLVTEGQPHTNQMGYSLWGLRPGEEVTMLSPNGDLYTKKSPIMILILAPLLVLGRAVPAWRDVQAALLLGPLLTAGTAVLLAIFARQSGYRRATAVLAALLYAFTTMALPYSQTIFGELLAAFGLLLALWACFRWRSDPNPRFALWCGVGAAGAIGVNAIYALVALLFGVSLAITNLKPRKTHLFHLFLFAAPILLLGVGLLLYNAVRFGSPLETGYHFAPGQEGFTTPLWWGLAGLLVSPARGLLWYSPPVILGLFGWFHWQRRERPFAWLVLAVISVQLLVFSLWWEWWGGYGWGPRFLLPVVPALMLGSLPVLETAVHSNGWARAAVILLAFVGLGVQVAGTAVDVNAYEQTLDAQFPAAADQPLRYHHDPALVYDVARAPIVAHWQAIIQGKWQPFWWQQPEVTRLPTIPAIIQAEQRPGEVLVFLEPTLLYDVLAAPGLPPAFGLPTNIAADDPLARRLWDHALADAGGVWLITWYGPGSPANWYEAGLRRDWASLSETWADELRLIHVAWPVQDGKETAVGDLQSHIPFGNITLTGYRLAAGQDTLFVTLQWQARAPITEDYVNFVHLLAADGTILAQQDRQPWGGYRPTSGWPIGETITDNFAFPLNEQTQNAQVIVGWYSWPDLTRLPVTLENGEVTNFYEISNDFTD